jgi:hypothetical protein
METARGRRRQGGDGEAATGRRDGATAGRRRQGGGDAETSEAGGEGREWMRPVATVRAGRGRCERRERERLVRSG